MYTCITLQSEKQLSSSSSSESLIIALMMMIPHHKAVAAIMPNSSYFSVCVFGAETREKHLLQDVLQQWNALPSNDVGFVTVLPSNFLPSDQQQPGPADGKVCHDCIFNSLRSIIGWYGHPHNVEDMTNAVFFLRNCLMVRRHN